MTDEKDNSIIKESSVCVRFVVTCYQNQKSEKALLPGMILHIQGICSGVDNCMRNIL